MTSQALLLSAIRNPWQSSLEKVCTQLGIEKKSLLRFKSILVNTRTAYLATRFGNLLSDLSSDQWERLVVQYYKTNILNNLDKQNTLLPFAEYLTHRLSADHLELLSADACEIDLAEELSPEAREKLKIEILCANLILRQLGDSSYLIYLIESQVEVFTIPAKQVAEIKASSRANRLRQFRDLISQTDAEVAP